MSRRQVTTLTLQVTVPVPQGVTQASTIEAITEHLRNPTSPMSRVVNVNAITVKLTGKDTIYL